MDGSAAVTDGPAGTPNFFDVDWETADPDLRGKVLAPFLGRPYGEALEAGEIRLAQCRIRRAGDSLFRQ